MIEVLGTKKDWLYPVLILSETLEYHYYALAQGGIHDFLLSGLMFVCLYCLKSVKSDFIINHKFVRITLSYL